MMNDSLASREANNWFIPILFGIAVINCLATVVTIGVFGFNACLGKIGLFYGAIQLLLFFVTVFLPAANSKTLYLEIRNANKPWLSYLFIAFLVQVALIVINYGLGSGGGYCWRS
jgi:hypothetical protein